MDLSKDYLYNRDRIVLLICDFYETSQIPDSMLEIKENLALFPVANVPLIEYTLTNLMDQDFKNVIIAGRKTDPIINHIKTTKFFNYMNIRALKCKGNTLGDLFREIDQNGFEFWDLIMMYANHYTNIPLKKLIKKHRDAVSTVMTVFTHKVDTNDIYTHVYVTKNSDICMYDKIQVGELNSQEIVLKAKEHGTIDVVTCYSGPTVAILSSHVFSIFRENFDFENLGDFISGMLAAGIYNYKFQLVTQDDLRAMCFDCYAGHPYECECSDSETNSDSDEEPGDLELYYSREVITLLDYYKINDDVLRMASSVFRMPQTPNYLKGYVKARNRIQNSVVGERCEIEGSLNNCIVWENCHLVNDFNDFIIVTDGQMFNLFHLEFGMPSSEPLPLHHVEEPKKDSFFDDFVDYLLSVAKDPKLAEIDLNVVLKQISLMRIVWNASRNEVIEAFGLFMVECIDVCNLEDSISLASTFFGALQEYVQLLSEQELLMESLRWNLQGIGIELKTQIFFNYAFVLVDAGIVDKSMVKKYSKIYTNGNL